MSSVVFGRYIVVYNENYHEACESVVQFLKKNKAFYDTIDYRDGMYNFFLDRSNMSHDSLRKNRSHTCSM
jgi:hypothetical protein